MITVLSLVILIWNRTLFEQ